MKTIFLLLFTTILSQNIFAQPLTETEPNNSSGTANLILLNQSFNGSINPLGDIDYYKFTASQGDTLAIRFAGENNSQLTSYIQLYDSLGEWINTNHMYNGEPVDLSFVINNTGTYFIRLCYNYGFFPNKAQSESLRIENEKRFTKQANSVQAQTGEYVISLKKFVPGVPVIEDVYFFNSYFDRTQVEAYVNANGLNTKVTFEYGTSTSYGDTAASVYFNSITLTYVESKLTGLSPNTTYHIRIKAANDSGEVYSNDYTFVTPESPENWVIKSLDAEIDMIDQFNDMYDILFPTKEIGFAIQGNQKILKTTDAGNTWTTYNTDYYLIKLFSIDSSNVVALSGAEVLKTTNCGLSWESFSTGAQFPPVNLFFTDLNNGYIVGYSGSILKTTDGGINWIAQNNNTTNNLNDIFFTDTDNGYVVGQNGTLLKTTNGGQTWNVLSSGTNKAFKNICFTDNKHGFIVTSTRDLLETTNGGVTWTTHTMEQYFNDISFVDRNNGILVGRSGTILLTSNSGASWEKQKSGTSNQLLSAAKTGMNWAVCGIYGTILISDYNLIPAHPLEVISPNGAEIYGIGSLQEIKWTSSGIANIKIEYTADSSKSWNTIVASISASAGSYYWQVPNAASEFCKIKISDAAALTVYDESDEFFEIGDFEETEPNNSAGQANLILLNQSGKGSISPLGDIDYYKFTAGAGDTLVVTIAGENNSWITGALILFDSRGNFIDYIHMHGEQVSLPFVFETSGTYFIRFAYSFDQPFPNKPQTEPLRIKNEEGFAKRENFLQAQTGDYVISLKRFVPGGPVIRYLEPFNSYFNRTQVEATVNANGLDTKVTFEYGTTTSYGDTAPPVYFNSVVPSSVVSELTGLTPNTIYYVRIKAENDSGEVYSDEFIFLTPESPENWIINSLDSTYTRLEDPFVFVKDIVFPTPDIGFAIYGMRKILKTTDAGNTWTTYNTNYNLYKLFSIDSNNVIALTGSRILKTTNGGLSWEDFRTGTEQYNSSLFFTDLNNGYVVGRSGHILKTTDGGISWIAQNSNTTNNLNDIFFTDAYNGYAVGENGTLLKTTNGGETWNVLMSGSTDIFWSIYFADNRHGFILTSTNDLLETANGGLTWTTQTMGQYIHDISFVDRNNGILVTNNGGTILRTTNSGSSWEKQKSGTSNQLLSGAKVGMNWAVSGIYGTILMSEYNLVPAHPLEVISPNGSEIYETGSLREIEWAISGIDNIKIEYTSDSSKSWNTIVSSINASAGSYSWRVPDSVSKFCKIKISDAAVLTVYDESDQFFEIGNFEEAEPNNSAGQANLIMLNDSLKGSISPQGDVDYYKFTASAGDTLVITIAGENNSLLYGDIILYDSSGVELDYNYMSSGESVDLPFIFETTATYFIRFGYNWDEFPNKSLRDIRGIENEKRLSKSNQANSIQDQTGDYVISLKRFAAKAPLISDVYFFNSYFNSTRVEAFVNANGLNTKVIFEYGASTSYGDTAASVYFSSLGYNYVESILTGLTPNTIYHVRVKAANDSGEVYSSDYTFLTPESPENWIVKSRDTYGYLYDVSFPTQDIGFAIESRYKILKTADAGNSWTTFNTRTAYDMDYYLIKLFSIDSSNIIALSEYDILKTTNSGLSWETFITGTEFENRNLFFTDLDNGYIVGWSGSILKTTDGGINWIAQNSNTTKPLNDVFFTNADNGYVVGDNGTLLKTTNGGETWNALPGGSTKTFRNICFTNNEHGFIMQGAFSDLLETTDGGVTWNAQNMEIYNLSDISFADESNGILVGDDGTILRTTNSGSSWEKQKSGTSNYLTAAAKTGKNWAVVGYDGTFLLSDYDLVSVKNTEAAPLTFDLRQNYPNPFNPTTTISYSIPEKSFVVLKVYDILGNEISTIVNEEKPAGIYELNFNAGSLASGIYLYKIQAGSFSNSKKFILMK